MSVSRNLGPKSDLGPAELNTHLLTKSELAALVEHLFYRMDTKLRGEIIARMPSAYGRLIGNQPTVHVGFNRDET